MSTDMLAHALDLAIRAEGEAAQKRDAANEAKIRADDAYTLSGSDRDLDATLKARLRAERAEKLYADAATKTEEARSKVEAADFARAKEKHAEDILALPHFPETLQRLHDRLVTLDREAYALLCDYDATVAAGQREWDRAAATAQRVHSHLGSIPRPTLADAILAAQLAATNAREDDDRDGVADLLDTPPGHGDWRVANLSAAERASHLAAAAANEEKRKADELRREGALGLIAQVKAGLPPIPPEPEHVEEEAAS